MIPTNSAPIRMNRKVELRKANTRNKTELTGFFEKITKMHVVIKNAANKKKSQLKTLSVFAVPFKIFTKLFFPYISVS